MLTTIAPGLFESTQPLRVAGFDLGHRMTVVQLPGGELAIHSPVELSTSVARDVELLAERTERVRWIIAPSVMHDLYLAEWMNHFPRAQLLHSPGLKLKGLDLARTIPLSRESTAFFDGALEAIPIDGMPRINEFDFFHPASRTLIVADLIFNLAPGRGFQKILQKVNGIHERTAPSRFFRQFISYDEGFQRAIAEILDKDFDRIIVGHGSKIEGGGKQVMREAFAWLRTVS